MLEILNIDDNYANSARSLRKIKTPFLNLIQLSTEYTIQGNNPIKDVEKMAVLKTSETVNTFTLDYKRDEFEIGSDLSFCFKFHMKTMKMFSKIA